MAATTESYQVNLPIFAGSLDLLLQLIEREKLDISVVSIAAVTDQFLGSVRQIEDVQPDTLADFLVIAARLVWIKSRILLPQPAQADEAEEEDPAATLARQLQEYRRFKQAAESLREIEARGRHTYPRVAPPPELASRLAEGSITLADLVAAAQSVLAGLPPAPPVPPGVVLPFTLTIRDQIELIRQETAAGRPVAFRALLSGGRASAHQRIEIVVTLLAVLELLKRREIDAVQTAMFGEIMIVPVPGAVIGDVEPDNGDL